MWDYNETGAGRPLVLLHGIGMSRTAWNAVIPHLRAARRVIAFDTAGFGSTPPLPQGKRPTIANLVEALADSIRALGLQQPVDIAGNSLGGAMALEAARHGLARSVVAISPAGLWSNRDSLHVKYVFKTLRFGATRFPMALKGALRRAWLRELAFAVPISIGSRRMRARDAARAVDDLGASRAFEATFASTRAPLVARDIPVPVTVAFGSRDWILLKRAQQRSALPPHTNWITKVGWGHVPMWIDPEGVAKLILEGTV